MEEGKNTNITINDLANKIDHQSRFTRTLVIICCFAVIGVNYFTFTQSVSTLPDTLVMSFMSRLSDIHKNWKLYDANPNK